MRRMSGRDPHEDNRVATPLELLFDLTFVIAIGVAASQLAHTLAGGHVAAGVLSFGVTTFAVCWAWPKNARAARTGARGGAPARGGRGGQAPPRLLGEELERDRILHPRLTAAYRGVDELGGALTTLEYRIAELEKEAAGVDRAAVRRAALVLGAGALLIIALVLFLILR